MIKKLIKYLSIITAPIFILALISYLNFGVLPDKIYLNDTESVSNISIFNDNIINKAKVTGDKVKFNLLGLIPIKSVPVQKVADLEVYPGGTSVGVRLTTEGVLVVGFSEIETAEGINESPAKLAGIELGDVILQINGEKINGSKDLISKVKSAQSENIKLDIQRNGKAFSKNIVLLKEADEFKMGLWVRDSTAGIGTLTFYHKGTESFGALGHPITDGDTNQSFMIKKGDLLRSSVLSVRKGERGTPGELKGLFLNERDSIGAINKNTESGIYGDANVPLINPSFNKPMPVGFRSEIVEGAAKIITTIGDGGSKEYNIEIVKLLPQDKAGPKSMLIKITDEELLEKTGGIVQGMSGSPIIQNGKIVGAVTHVLINKPELGYGIYIEWMLEDAGILQ